MKKLILLFIGCMLVMPVHAEEEGKTKYTQKELFKIHWGDEDGKIGREVSEGSLETPAYFTVDDEGNIYILDYINTRVVVFSPKGEFIKNIKISQKPPFGRAVMTVDKHKQLWMIPKKQRRKGYICEVYNEKGKSLKKTMLPSDISSIDLVIDQVNKPLLFGDKSHFDKKTRRSKILKLTQFNFDEEIFELKPMTTISPTKIKKGKQIFIVEKTLDKKTSRSHFILKNNDGKTIKKIKGRVKRIDSRGNIYSQSSLRNIDVIDPSGTKIYEVNLKGHLIAVASPYVDAKGDIYQLDLIPDVTDEEIKTFYPPPSANDDIESFHYSISSPGIRVIKWSSIKETDQVTPKKKINK